MAEGEKLDIRKVSKYPENFTLVAYTLFPPPPKDKWLKPYFREKFEKIFKNFCKNSKIFIKIFEKLL